MKKILSILGTVALVVPVSSTAVACNYTTKIDISTLNHDLWTMSFATTFKDSDAKQVENKILQIYFTDVIKTASGYNTNSSVADLMLKQVLLYHTADAGKTVTKTDITSNLNVIAGTSADVSLCVSFDITPKSDTDNYFIGNSSPDLYFLNYPVAKIVA